MGSNVHFLVVLMIVVLVIFKLILMLILIQMLGAIIVVVIMLMLAVMMIILAMVIIVVVMMVTFMILIVIFVLMLILPEMGGWILELHALLVLACTLRFQLCLEASVVRDYFGGGCDRVSRFIATSCLKFDLYFSWQFRRFGGSASL